MSNIIGLHKGNNNGHRLLQAQKTVLAAGIKRKQPSYNAGGKKLCSQQHSALKCAAILPGIPGISEFYSDDSGSESDRDDSSDSSDADEPSPPVGGDFVGRKIKQKCTQQDDN